MAGRLAVAYIDIVGRIKPFTDSLQQARGRLRSFLKDSTSEFKLTARTMKRIGSRMTLFVTAPMILMARKMVGVSSAVEEQTAKFHAVFKDTAPAVLKWADTYSKAVKRSKYDIIEWLAAVQDIFVPMGFAREEAAEFSKKLVALAIDLASFQDKAEPDVINDLTSGLMGMSRAMFKYGVNIRDGRVKQKAYAMGLAKTGEEIAELSKLEARYQLIVEDAKDAIGDAERTAGSFANSVRALQAATKDLSKAWGDMVKGAIKPGVIWLTKFIKQLERGPRAAKLFATALGLIASSLGPLLVAGGGLAQMISTLMQLQAGAKLIGLAKGLGAVAVAHPAAAAIAATTVATGGILAKLAQKEIREKREGTPEEQRERAIENMRIEYGHIRRVAEKRRAAEQEWREPLRRRINLLNAEERMRRELLALMTEEERKALAFLEKKAEIGAKIAAQLKEDGVEVKKITEWTKAWESAWSKIYDTRQRAAEKMKDQEQTAAKTLREMSKSWMSPLGLKVSAIHDRAAEFRKILGEDIRIKKWAENEKLKAAKEAIESEMGLVGELGDAIKATWEPQWMSGEDKWRRAMVAGSSVTYTASPEQVTANYFERLLTIQEGVLRRLESIEQSEQRRLYMQEEDRAMERMN